METDSGGGGPFPGPLFTGVGPEETDPAIQLEIGGQVPAPSDGQLLVAKRLFGLRNAGGSHLLLLFALLVMINLIVILGNILVILAVYATAKLRNVTNIFIVSLATADLLLGVLVLPYALTFEILDVWIFGKIWCRGWLVTDVWISTASILNLCAISVDRYVAVTRPVKYRSIMTPRKAKTIVAGVWIVSFLICCPPLLPQWGYEPARSPTSPSARARRQLELGDEIQFGHFVATAQAAHDKQVSSGGRGATSLAAEAAMITGAAKLADTIAATTTVPLAASTTRADVAAHKPGLSASERPVASIAGGHNNRADKYLTSLLLQPAAHANPSRPPPDNGDDLPVLAEPLILVLQLLSPCKPLSELVQHFNTSAAGSGHSPPGRRLTLVGDRRFLSGQGWRALKCGAAIMSPAALVAPSSVARAHNRLAGRPIESGAAIVFSPLKRSLTDSVASSGSSSNSRNSRNSRNNVGKRSAKNRNEKKSKTKEICETIIVIDNKLCERQNNNTEKGEYISILVARESCNVQNGAGRVVGDNSGASVALWPAEWEKLPTRREISLKMENGDADADGIRPGAEFTHQRERQRSESSPQWIKFKCQSDWGFNITITIIIVLNGGESAVRSRGHLNGTHESHSFMQPSSSSSVLRPWLRAPLSSWSSSGRPARVVSCNGVSVAAPFGTGRGRIGWLRRRRSSSLPPAMGACNRTEVVGPILEAIELLTCRHCPSRAENITDLPFAISFVTEQIILAGAQAPRRARSATAAARLPLVDGPALPAELAASVGRKAASSEPAPQRQRAPSDVDCVVNCRRQRAAVLAVAGPISNNFREKLCVIIKCQLQQRQRSPGSLVASLQANEPAPNSGQTGAFAYESCALSLLLAAGQYCGRSYRAGCVQASLASKDKRHRNGRRRRHTARAEETLSRPESRANGTEARAEAEPTTSWEADSRQTGPSERPEPRLRRSGCALFDDKPYVIYSALGSFYIPMLIMIFFYSRIYLVASRAQKAMQRGYMTTKWPLPAHGGAAANQASGGQGSMGATGNNSSSGTTGGSLGSRPERVTLRIHRREKSPYSEEQQSATTTNSGNEEGRSAGLGAESYRAGSGESGSSSALMRLTVLEQQKQQELVRSISRQPVEQPPEQPETAAQPTEPQKRPEAEVAPFNGPKSEAPAEPDAEDEPQRIDVLHQHRHRSHRHHHRRHRCRRHRCRRHLHGCHRRHYDDHADEDGQEARRACKGRHHCSCGHGAARPDGDSSGHTAQLTMIQGTDSLRSRQLESRLSDESRSPAGTQPNHSPSSGPHESELNSVQITVSQYCDEWPNSGHSAALLPAEEPGHHSEGLPDASGAVERAEAKSQSFVPAPSIVVNWQPDTGSVETRLAGAELDATSNRPAAGQQAAVTTAAAAAASMSGSQASGLSIMASLPNQVRKQSMMLLTTLTTRSSQTLRRLSMVASHPVDSLLNRSKSRDSDSSGVVASDDAGEAGRRRKSGAKKKKGRRKGWSPTGFGTSKRTLDDYLMAVAGIDSSSAESGADEEDEEEEDEDEEDDDRSVGREAEALLDGEPLGYSLMFSRDRGLLTGSPNGWPSVPAEPAIDRPEVATLPADRSSPPECGQTEPDELDCRQSGSTGEPLRLVSVLHRQGGLYERATSRTGSEAVYARDETTHSSGSRPAAGQLGSGLRRQPPIPAPLVSLVLKGAQKPRRRAAAKRTSRWHAKRLHAETKAAKTVAIIIGGFIFCWLPFFTAYLSRAIICERPDCIPQSLLSLFIWLGYLNSAINPVIYGLFSADFRHAFKNILCRCHCRNTDDTVVVLVDSIIKSIL